MSAIVKGTAHLYGIQAGVAAITNATVVSVSLNKEYKNTSETVNEIGNVIERRYDDLTTEGTITIRPRSGFTSLLSGTNVTYGGVSYEVYGEGRQEEQAGFVTITYNIRQSANIS
jgi:hypothetical protein